MQNNSMQEDSNIISKLNNEYNSLYSYQINDKDISSTEKCPPIDTRVFDVYLVKDISKDTPFLDVFAKEFHLKKPIKQEFIDENHDVLNNQPPYVTPKSSGINVGSSTGTMIVIPSKSNVDESVSIQISDATSEDKIIRSSTVNNQISTFNSGYSSDTTNDFDIPSTNVTKYTSSNSYIAKDTADKWPSNIEEAFIASLKLVPKKGTSKIKLSNKNYGRNELISLYIYYHTKNFRSKKQISSHIQVLKKAINSKKDNNLDVTDSELELYDLIENGAPKTDTTREDFEKEFTVIIEELEKEMLKDPKRVLCKIFPMLNPLARKKIHLLNGNCDKQNRVITPNSVKNNVNFDLKNEEDQALPKDNSVLIYPAKYAKDMYENLPEYKCFPVNIEDNNVYCPYQRVDDNNSKNNNEKSNNYKLSDNMFGTKPMSRDDALIEASKIENQQRDLIDMVNESLQAQQSIEEDNNTIESSTINSNNNIKKYKKDSTYQNHNNTNVPYKNNLLSANNSINSQETLPYYTDYYSNPLLQCNTLLQPSIVPIDSQNNKMKTNTNELLKHSQSLVQADLDLLQNQSQLYSRSQKNRLYPNFTPIDGKFPSNYPPPQWFSPNNQLAMSQYNFIPPQYTQNSDFVEYKSGNQPVMRQPQSSKQPFFQYQPSCFTSGNPLNVSPVYPTFNSQFINNSFQKL